MKGRDPFRGQPIDRRLRSSLASRSVLAVRASLRGYRMDDSWFFHRSDRRFASGRWFAVE
jgi:hypothetical protein